MPPPEDGLKAKSVSEKAAISRHSEVRQNRKNPADYNLEQLQNNQNSFSETVFSRFTSHFSLPKIAFTLVEVLITLGIIGVVAALTIPSLISNYQDKQFKTAYKKVYSEMSQIFQEGIIENKFTRITTYSAQSNLEEMNFLKEKLKVTKDCPFDKNRKTSSCWKKGDTLCGGECSSGNAEDGVDYENGVPYASSNCFVDSSGRNWCSYDSSINIFVVDINGFNPPNQFGKDRYIFTFGNKNGTHTNQASEYAKIIPFAKDTSSTTYYCKHPPCYYYSWLYN